MTNIYQNSKACAINQDINGCVGGDITTMFSKKDIMTLIEESNGRRNEFTKTYNDITTKYNNNIVEINKNISEMIDLHITKILFILIEIYDKVSQVIENNNNKSKEKVSQVIEKSKKDKAIQVIKNNINFLELFKNTQKNIIKLCNVDLKNNVGTLKSVTNKKDINYIDSYRKLYDIFYSVLQSDYLKNIVTQCSKDIEEILKLERTIEQNTRKVMKISSSETINITTQIKESENILNNLTEATSSLKKEIFVISAKIKFEKNVRKLRMAVEKAEVATIAAAAASVSVAKASSEGSYAAKAAAEAAEAAEAATEAATEAADKAAEAAKKAAAKAAATEAENAVADAEAAAKAAAEAAAKAATEAAAKAAKAAEAAATEAENAAAEAAKAAAKAATEAAAKAVKAAKAAKAAEFAARSFDAINEVNEILKIKEQAGGGSLNRDKYVPCRKDNMPVKYKCVDGKSRVVYRRILRNGKLSKTTYVKKSGEYLKLVPSAKGVSQRR